MTENFIQSNYKKSDPSFEVSLRPKTLQEFVGQKNVTKRLHILLTAAKKRNEALGHLLLAGPPGLGKTTLAYVIAQEMNAKITITSGPSIEKAGDLAGLLTSLQKGEVLFIDEIHRLSKVAEEYLYPAMENMRLDLMIDSGPAARSVQVKLNPFTLIGATTKSGMLSAPLRSRFVSSLRVDPYHEDEIETIIQRTANLLKTELHPAASMQIAKRSRGTPRIANNLTAWIRDYAQSTNHEEIITEETTQKALLMAGIDHKGLDEMDMRILYTLVEKFQGEPVGLQTLAISVHEESSTIEEVYEPFLIQSGLLQRTPRGRIATKLAFEHLGKIYNGDQIC